MKRLLIPVLIVGCSLMSGCAVMMPVGAAIGAAALGAATNAAVSDVNTIIIDANQDAMKKLQDAANSKHPVTPTPTPTPTLTITP